MIFSWDMNGIRIVLGSNGIFTIHEHQMGLMGVSTGTPKWMDGFSYGKCILYIYIYKWIILDIKYYKINYIDINMYLYMVVTDCGWKRSCTSWCEVNLVLFIVVTNW